MTKEFKKKKKKSENKNILHKEPGYPHQIHTFAYI